MSVTAARTCFVVMPIRQPGTPEFEHFRTIRETVIQPALLGLGYSVTRADDISRSGAITKDIVDLLAYSDLVVADLTDLNPNVFYELGARHSLRKNGTIMLVDETRSEIPFDLLPYRTIKYEPTLSGAEHVRAKLAEFAASMDPDGAADNPIHTFLPALPSDLVAQASGTSEGKIRAEMEALRAKLARYEREFGPIVEGERSIDALIERLGSEARGEMLPSDLIGKAQSAAERRDIYGFVEIMQTLVQSGIRRLTGTQFVELASLARTLGLHELEEQILDEGHLAHPNDSDFEKIVLQSLAHSTDPVARKGAREKYQAMLGLRKAEDGTWRIPDEQSAMDLASLAVMLDAYHRDKLFADALEISRLMAKNNPNSDIALRNFARALESNDRIDDALVAHQAAVAVSGPGKSTAASWYGNILSRLRRLVDSLEAHCVAAILDPNDGEGFLDMASALSRALEEEGRDRFPFLVGSAPSQRPRSVPESLDASLIEELGYCAFSCPQLSSSDVEFASIIYSPEQLQAMLICRTEGSGRRDKAHREAIAADVYATVGSTVTQSGASALARVEELLGGDAPASP